jgi:diguanylate cyclase (GGDEF)-like protein
VYISDSDGLSRADLRLALAGMTADALVPTGFGLAVLYAFFSAGWLLVDAPYARLDTAITAATAIVCLASALWMRRHPVAPRLAHPIAAGFCALALGNGLLTLAQERLPGDTLDLIVVLIGSTIVLRSLPYVLCAVAVCAGGWWYVVSRMPNRAEFDAFHYTIVSACLLGIMVHTALARTARRLERARHELRRAAELDPLTGLYNRRGFWLYGERILQDADRDGAPLTALFVDIDQMKRINDELGHAAGDAAIVETASLLRRAVRTGDVVARLGGDEFCALLPWPGEPAAVRERLVGFLAEANRGRARALSLSIGSASYQPGAPCSLEDLLHRGDTAMYQHKQRGRSRVDDSRSGTPVPASRTAP